MASTESFDFGPPISPEGLWTPTLDQRDVRLRYEGHELRGTLCLTTSQVFTSWHCRFYDILPSTLPHLNDSLCEPWVLLNPILGKTWIPFSDLPAAVTMSAFHEIDADTIQPVFVGLTDNAKAFAASFHQHGIAGNIGDCDADGNLTLQGFAKQFESDILIALASTRPMVHAREMEPRKISKKLKSSPREVLDYPPLAVDPRLITIIGTLKAALADTNIAVNQLRKRLREDLRTALDSSGNLPKDHPLYAHRGNEAVCPREIWTTLCYPCESWTSELATRFDYYMPKPYYQALFLDLQAQKRVEGTWKLNSVDEKWYRFGLDDDFETFRQAVERKDSDVEMADTEERTEDDNVS